MNYTLKYALAFLFIFSMGVNGMAQDKVNLATKLKGLTHKGNYAIIEVRLNKEDEFRTIEGSSSSLARISIFSGNNQGTEVLSKGFDGMNSIITILNDLKQNGWRLINVYSIKGESLIITHYVIERRK